ncbi:MAG: hypothetical protein QXK45_06715 [Thermofilaceae archaeon]
MEVPGEGVLPTSAGFALSKARCTWSARAKAVLVPSALTVPSPPKGAAVGRASWLPGAWVLPCACGGKLLGLSTMLFQGMGGASSWAPEWVWPEEAWNLDLSQEREAATEFQALPVIWAST